VRLHFVFLGAANREANLRLAKTNDAALPLSMKKNISLAILLFLLATAQPVRAQDFVRVYGTQFTLDGKPFYYAGANTYYLGIDQNTTQGQIDEVLNDAKAMGLSVIRTWGFNDGPGGLQTSPGAYNETIFAKLDYTINKAADLGLKLIIPFVNNWDDYGGMNQYVSWVGAGSHDDFYSNTICKDYYKDHINTLLNRVNSINGLTYKNDPTIMAWELANEATGSSSTTLKSWISEMSLYVKSIDSNHLLTTGVDGREMALFRKFHKDMTAVDFATMHIYPDYWHLDLEAARQYVDERIVEANTMLRMPVILEEFGKYRDTSPPVPDPAVSTGGTGHTATRDRFYQDLYTVVRENHGAGSNFWSLYHDSYPDYDGFGVYYPADTDTVGIIHQEAALMAAQNTAYRTVPIFDFGTGTQGWKGDWGGLSVQQTEDKCFPLTSNGALEVTGLDLDGSSVGWIDGGAVRFIPWNWGVMDFSGEGIEKFTVQILAPEEYGNGLKASLYIHTGSGWAWHEGGWFDLALGDWTELYIEASGLDMSSLRDFGVHFAVDGTFYKGPVYIDFLATETPVPIPGAIFLFGSALAAVAGLRGFKKKE